MRTIRRASRRGEGLAENKEGAQTQERRSTGFVEKWFCSMYGPPVSLAGSSCRRRQILFRYYEGVDVWFNYSGNSAFSPERLAP